MTRESLLASATYPEFTETKRKLCRRISSISAKQISFQGGGTLKIAAKTPTQFGSETLPWGKLAGFFREGDWIGVELDSKRQVVAVQMLAPRVSENREPQVSIEILKEWNLYLSTIRQFFNSRGFLEVQTPTLVTCPGTEPFLDVFKTEFKKGRDQREFFLPTSPELHLKKMVAAGYGPLYEIRPCFRNGEVSEVHQPEFWMLEWYRPGQTLESIQKDCVDLVNACAKALKKKAPKKIETHSMAELFRAKVGFELKPGTNAAELIKKAQELKIFVTDDSDFDDAFYLLFLEKIENALKKDALTFVSDYPPSQAALARLTPEGWGDRFELYWKGMELANAYHELNDPKIQRERSKEDLEKRTRLNRQKISLDEEFFAALEGGMPPTSGIALGVERLFLALTERKTLTEIRVFPIRA